MRNSERKMVDGMCTKNRCFTFRRSFFVTIFLAFSIYNVFVVLPASASKQAKAVDTWAQEFGMELNHLAKLMTKVNEIKDKYKQYNARVVEKGELINSTVRNVGRMLRRKIDAVRCIAHTAEEAVASFNHSTFNNTEQKLSLHYYSSKYSILRTENMTDEEAQNITCNLEECEYAVIMKNKYTYLPMELTRDTHFYNISVNTQYSSVHVPVNVYDQSNSSLKVLNWTAKLDEVFVHNYKADPALSWQYFGSETGILRHFPAKSWENRDIESEIDVYDCRKRSWYIETATCSKDIIILLDNSGSMYNFLSFLAELTIKSILDTFSNNDFFNIVLFSNGIHPLVECFDGELIQATPENIKVFKNKIKLLEPAGYANDSIIQRSFERAFRILEEYRDKRNCTDMTCNQAIMYVADSVQGNLTDIINKYNRIQTDNGTEIPVRIFTYLLGKETPKVKEMRMLACQNRGDFQHIQTLDEVQEKVLEYVKTIAAPLVLQDYKHPPTWTHAFKDVTYTDELTSIPPGDKHANPSPPPRLMIAVGVPAFNRTDDPNFNNTPGLLGVASTDVPVDDINRLSLPYKLGVNGYSFIVSNNGYLLVHPDLRPMYYYKLHLENISTPIERHILKENYNSIEFTEVEQLDAEEKHMNLSLRPELGGEALKELRALAMSNTFCSMLNVSVRLHYDKMRRVSEEKYDYYFAPLRWTPFTLGLAIPSTYGQTFIKVGNEIRNNINKGLNISEWFIGENWKVHPDWVYCKYHYLEGHEFDNSEQELLHFLKSFYNESWVWSSQYEAADKDDENDDDVEGPIECSRKSLDEDGYYCNQELVQLLVFDAKVTNTSYGTWRFDSEGDKNLAAIYNANLRFVATMSGLTRWQFICGEIEVEDDKEFGDYYTRAIDEPWYRSAVLQHRVDPESFVYSVPHDDPDDTKEEGDRKVTASHAVFRTDGGKKAPGCVVGFQFEHEKMQKRFDNITSRDNCDGCLRGCGHPSVKCYVVDNNGYIILSKDQDDAGVFFGEVQGSVMIKLIEQQVFKNMTIYDFQAMCRIEEKEDNFTSDGNVLLTPWNLVENLLKWALVETFFYLGNIHMWTEAYFYCDTPPPSPPATPSNTTFVDEDSDEFKKLVADAEDEERRKYEPCDQMAYLYVMEQEPYGQTQSASSLTGSLHYSRIPYSNLLLVYVTDEEPNNRKLDASLQKIEYDTPFPCHKLNVNSLSTRPLTDCFTLHPDEGLLITCSRGRDLKLDHFAILCMSSLLMFSTTVFRNL